MTVLEREAKKAELARSILNIESDDILEKLSNYYKNLTKKMPCVYSDEEIREGADRFLDALNDYNNGNTSQFTSHEEVKKRFNRIS